jgi:ACS family tartrate transporter-like MFS transporter
VQASLWYAPKERAERLSYIYLAQPLAGLIGSGIAAFVMKTLEGVLGLRAWRWLFVVEGVPSMMLGLLCWVWLPAGPATASWLSEEERAFLVRRHAEGVAEKKAQEASSHRDDAPLAVGWLDRGQAYVVRLYRTTFSNRLLWMCCFMNWLCLTPVQSVSFYLPSIISDHGLSQLTGNLLSLPIYGTASVFMVVHAIHSDRTHERFYHILIMNLVGGVGLLFTAIAMSTSALPPTDMIALQVIALTISAIGVWASKPPAMALYLQSVPGDLAVAIATVTTVGNISGVTAPLAMSYLREASGSYVTGCVFLMMCLFMASGVIVMIRREIRRVDGNKVYEKVRAEVEMEGGGKDKFDVEEKEEVQEKLVNQEDVVTVINTK